MKNINISLFQHDFSVFHMGQKLSKHVNRPQVFFSG